MGALMDAGDEQSPTLYEKLRGNFSPQNNDSTNPQARAAAIILPYARENPLIVPAFTEENYSFQSIVDNMVADVLTASRKSEGREELYWTINTRRGHLKQILDTEWAFPDPSTFKAYLSAWTIKHHMFKKARHFSGTVGYVDFMLEIPLISVEVRRLLNTPIGETPQDYGKPSTPLPLF